MVEEVAIGEIRRRRTSEITAHTARALKKERTAPDEDTLIAALPQFDDLWQALIRTEQAWVVQLQVAGVMVGEDRQIGPAATRPGLLPPLLPHRA